VKIILLCCSLLVSFLAGEAVTRFSGLAPEVVYIEKWRMRLSSNPLIGYEPVPYLDGTGQSLQFYSYHDRSNFMGYRDKDWELIKPEGTHRIVILGDSVAEGLWVSRMEDIFPFKLSELLSSESTGYEIMNFAVSGYNTRQEVETLRTKALPFSPDTVILAYCLNDTQEDNGNIIGFLISEEKEKSSSIHAHRISAFSSRSHLYRLVKYRLLPLLKKTSDSTASRTSLNHLRENSVHQSLLDLKELSEKHSFDVIIAIFPDFTNIDRNVFINEFREEHEKVRRMAEDAGLKTVDMFDYFAECKKDNPENLLSFDKYHMRPEGHTCAANALYEILVENLF
jgi:lysophospholipase L1-like esterase